MGVAGSISPPGGAPKPDPARVAAIRYTIVDELETCLAFGESARATLAALNDRTLAETRSGDLGECALLLDHIRDRLAGLDPARLEPRTGLAGLFDSRSKRLKGLRVAFASAASAVTQSAVDIGDRAGALARKDAALETLWAGTRDAIAELDAHIAAARGWLTNEAPTDPVAETASVEPLASEPEPVDQAQEACEAQADAEANAGASSIEVATDPESVEDDEAASSEEAPVLGSEPVATLPHPLETRLTALEAVRATAIGRLALVRAAQNADCRTPASLKQVCDGVEAWRADWQDALGMAGKRPKKVRPDRVRLSSASTTLIERIQIAAHEISAAKTRRAELDTRAAPAAPVRLAA